ncbi:hypothetical protein AWM75_05735 [Aerococcus urinaehominis]|uniref:Uncharacterized protein n=1 Tax=Aerococcus urinaehominis TaxID=128944 RepID=A0A0X8FLI2_9LACT|nr:DUF975 family protein [Aerococcus urinaehominis]AMB99528.1 hypothetical protein AWM75_05735 [Aerococcus urinaehominis]SDM33997.1 Protein of unknown function [Aerococcus urinaehominis]
MDYKRAAKLLLAQDKDRFIGLTLVVVLIQLILLTSGTSFFFLGLAFWALYINIDLAYQAYILAASRKLSLTWTNLVSHHWLKAVASQLLGHLQVLLAFICFILPGIYLKLAYALLPYVLVDFPDLSVGQSLGLARRLMKGRKWALILLYSRFILWGLSIIFSFGLSYFYVRPYLSLARAYFYQDSLTKQGLNHLVTGGNQWAQVTDHQGWDDF